MDRGKLKDTATPYPIDRLRILNTDPGPNSGIVTREVASVGVRARAAVTRGCSILLQCRQEMRIASLQAALASGRGLGVALNLPLVGFSAPSR